MATLKSTKIMPILKKILTKNSIPKNGDEVWRPSQLLPIPRPKLKTISESIVRNEKKYKMLPN